MGEQKVRQHTVRRVYLKHFAITRDNYNMVGEFEKVDFLETSYLEKD